MNYRVVEKFVSINGEGPLSGQLAVFVRFPGCNLDCSYCDTSWANYDDVTYDIMTEEDIYDYIKATGVNNVTLTGGEPLLQDGIVSLLKRLSSDESLNIEIETNGSVFLEPFDFIRNPSISFTMDYKLATSNMEQYMNVENFQFLNKNDTVKFVVGTIDDLERAKEIIHQYGLINRTRVYLSPVFDKIPMEKIVDFMKDSMLNGVTLQIQLHKVIWEPEKRGV